MIQGHQTYILQNGPVLKLVFTKLTSKGKVSAQIANYSDSDIYLKSKTPTGVISEGEVTPEVFIQQVSLKKVVTGDARDR